MSHQEHHPSGRGETATTARPALSIAVTRELPTVVVTLGGPLEAGSCTVLRDLLWDLVVAQGNLSLILDARDLVLSDPVLLANLTVLGREAAHRGGTFVVLDPSLLPAPLAGHSAEPARLLTRPPFGTARDGGATGGRRPDQAPNHERSAG